MLTFHTVEIEKYKTTIPCIKNRCLKYAVCKHKSIIACDDLLEFQQNIQLLAAKRKGATDMTDGVFDSYVVINEILLKVYGIRKE